ncbi:530ded2a-4197-4fc5-808a-d498004358e7 [Thermothielavioides terrestris]|uniref:530ded2a-4197-4fc5-808a-d498004358e7 n=1 Tax=Thermothielavioides terrestris TaxID=2587410 RepID=A0A3S4F164_9PEZI|nr:530ded2a-4197-4fc5-808a-d498004358e7 [Thermothielavioides terrestris]
MDEFIIEHAERYKRLVSTFKPSSPGAKATNSTSASSEIVVSARIRPMLEDEIAQGFPQGVYQRADSNMVDLHELRRPSFSFTVDRVFGPDAATPEIYESVVKPLVPWAWGGGVGTMFAYGQTGSGKTYTVSGLERHVAETLMDGSLDGERKIHISVIELAGQTAFDLLNDRKQISILEDSFGNTQMAGALEHRVTDKDALLQFIEAAAFLRRTAPTLKNDTSSRSHAICRLRFENPLLPSAEDGLLYLVDLAGSEAARDKTEHDTTRMKEAKEINTSLSVLKDCIRGRALADADAFAGKASRKPAYVPFRQSTLTKTLKHVFDPASARSCKTVVVACVNPCLADVGASKNTLRYAEMLRVLVSRPKAAEYSPTVPATWNNEQLRDWIERNSGDPPITASILAPLETGPQLLRLPAPEFLSRCLKTPGVSPEQAQAFHTKLWKLHIDSQHQLSSLPATTGRDNNNNSSSSSSSSSSKTDPLASTAAARLAQLDSSADPDQAAAAAVPFQQRIRPGMVVRWRPPPKYACVAATGGQVAYAVVLCPAAAVGAGVRDMKGVLVNPGGEGSGLGDAYLCATVVPGLLPGSFGVGLWRQVVVRVEEMEAEVLMEWDEATRYYYMTV